MRRANVLRWAVPIVALVLSVVTWQILATLKVVPTLSRRVFAQAPDPRSIYGSWDPQFDTPVLMVHAMVLPIGPGQVLFWNTNYNWDPNPDRIAHPYLWDPASNSFTPYSLDPPGQDPPNNLFCTGHALLPSGRVLVTGGHWGYFDPNSAWHNIGAGKGLAYTNIFDPFAANGPGWWTGFLPSMSNRRWYPTNTPMGDGSTVTQSGTDENGDFIQIPERWGPDGTGGGTWTALTGVGNYNGIAYYPWVYQDPRLGHEKQVFVAGPSMYADDLDVIHQNPNDPNYPNNGPGYWLQTGPSRDSYPSPYPYIREYGSSVMYGPGQILVAGGRAPGLDDVGAPTNSAEIINLCGPNNLCGTYSDPPAWQQTGFMQNGRKHMNATMLPDGRVLVTGGTSGTCSQETDENYAVRDAEIWNPGTGQWTYAGTMQNARLYHSVALLLPDARVLVAGGGEGGSCTSQDFPVHMNAEIYSPSYLFQGGTRPVITGVTAPSYGNDGDPEVGYNDQLSFTVNINATDISQVSLVRLPAVTHL
jgi:hypothetical protein